LSHYHFLGIAGTAMAGTALLMQELGHTVSGSDEAIYPPMSALLESKGIQVKSPFSENNLPDSPYTGVIGRTTQQARYVLFDGGIVTLGNFTKTDADSRCRDAR